MHKPWVETKRNQGDSARWYLPPMWQMMGFSAWLRLLRSHSFRMSPAKVPVALSITFSSLFTSAMGVVQTVLFGRRLRKVIIKHDPIFVIGHWRSGTTHLHDLLSLDERYAFPTTFECNTPQHCLVTERIFPLMWGWIYPKKRPIDGVAYGLERPQEDECGLLALGAPTPMWWTAYPDARVGQRFLSLRDVTDRERRKWQAVMLKFLRLLTYRHQGKALILKSPPHTARVKLLAQMFPNARFVHIVRDPVSVFASTVHLWRTLHEINGLVPVRELAIEAFVLQCMKDIYADFDSAVAELPSHRFHQLRYEDLAANPQVALRECYRALDLGDFELARPRIDEYLRKLNGYQTNTYEISPEAVAAVRNAWGPIYEKWGYQL